MTTLAGARKEARRPAGCPTKRAQGVRLWLRDTSAFGEMPTALLSLSNGQIEDIVASNWGGWMSRNTRTLSIDRSVSKKGGAAHRKVLAMRRFCCFEGGFGDGSVGRCGLLREIRSLFCADADRIQGLAGWIRPYIWIECRVGRSRVQRYRKEAIQRQFMRTQA